VNEVPPRTDLDIAIVGGGPAGLTAGIYAARAGLSAAVFERAAIGGQAAITDVVENYPGVAGEISGFDLSAAMRSQAERFGCAFRSEEVTAVEAPDDSPVRRVISASGPTSALAVIAASGADPRRLGVPGEERFWGRGISCCATCDGMFYRGKRVVVVGGGDTAVKEATFLTRFAAHISLVHRRGRLRAASANQDRLKAHGEKVEYVLGSRVLEVLGGETVTGVLLEDVESGDRRELACDGVFLFVGYVPVSGYLPESVGRDERGYVLTDDDMATSVPGVYACGDVRKKRLRQIVTACGEAATAAFAAQGRVEDLKGTAYE
jgi:thioredoxin reductase (NADPH)